MPTIIASIISGAWPLLLAVAVFAIGYGQGQDKAKADYAAAEVKRIYYADKNAQAAAIQYRDRVKLITAWSTIPPPSLTRPPELLMLPPLLLQPLPTPLATTMPHATTTPQN